MVSTITNALLKVISNMVIVVIVSLFFSVTLEVFAQASASDSLVVEEILEAFHNTSEGKECGYMHMRYTSKLRYGSKSLETRSTKMWVSGKNTVVESDDNVLVVKGGIVIGVNYIDSTIVIRSASEDVTEQGDIKVLSSLQRSLFSGLEIVSTKKEGNKKTVTFNPKQNTLASRQLSSLTVVYNSKSKELISVTSVMLTGPLEFLEVEFVEILIGGDCPNETITSFFRKYYDKSSPELKDFEVLDFRR